MPIIKQAKYPKDSLSPSVTRRLFINEEMGAKSLTVGEATIAPGGSIPLHIHPGHEEGIFIAEGTLEGRLGDEKSKLTAGDFVLAPAGVKHDLVNNTQRPARIIFIYPTTKVTRQVVE